MKCRLGWLCAIAVGLACILAWAQEPASRPSSADGPTLFDPARHMLVSEVKPGMKGYGLTVFKGTRIERFDVEVLSILRNFNPKSDVVLIRCTGDYLQHTGSIAGMSGSPIFLKDGQGKYRIIGAFAYGWPLTKDPVAGVQPIEYMLRLPVGDKSAPTDESGAARASGDAGNRQATDQSGGLSWSLVDAGLVPFNRPLIADDANSQAVPFDWGLDSTGTPQLAPLATPLMAGGISPRLLKEVAPLFAHYGLTALQSGGGGSSPDREAQSAPKLEPGSVLAVPLLTGDVDMTAIGTVTEVIGNRVFGFGHPFNDEGAIALPMGSGEIHGIIPNLNTSFKLGSIVGLAGELTTDESVGVAGSAGARAPTVPVEFTVRYADGRPQRVYHFQSVQHPRFTPMIAGVALSAAATGQSELPQYNTVEYNLTLRFSDGRKVEIANTAANATPQELLSEVSLPLLAASDNPFEHVQVEKITGTVTILPQARLAQILEVNVPRSRYRPGETVKAFVTCKPFRLPEEILPLELELPRDLPQGTYQLIISDAQRYFQDEQQSEPFRFTAGNITDVFGVLKDVAAIRQNAVYMRLLRQPDGVAVGRVAMPELPSSRRQILLGAGRSNIMPFINSTLKVVPTERVMNGSAQFALTIDPQARVEVVGPTGMPQPSTGTPKSTQPPKSSGSQPPAKTVGPSTQPSH